MAFAQTSLSKI